MRILIIPALLALAAGAAPTHAQESDAALLEQAAQQRADAQQTAQQPDDVTATGGDDGATLTEAQAMAEVTLAKARLELVRGRQALKAEDFTVAAVHAQRVLDLLRTIDSDVTPYTLQAEGILARAERAGVDVSAARKLVAGETAEGESRRRAARSLDREAAIAAGIAADFDGADTDLIDTTVSAETLKRRARENQTLSDFEPWGYRPAREIFDHRDLALRNRQRTIYQGGLLDANKDVEARLLVDAEEARMAPEGLISYPDDWAYTAERRAKWSDGAIAKSRKYVDESGREWHVALYDIRGLIYQPPDFTLDHGFNLYDDMVQAQDRAALRRGSEIFNGFPEDLAAGIPLLRYFGGVDDFAYRGPKYDYEQAREIVETIESFTRRFEGERATEPSVQLIGP